VSLTVYGPDDAWPEHQNDYWRQALKQARAAGWTLKYLGAAHRFGQVLCPGPADEQHSFTVDSTARGSETKALEVPKLLRKCRHGTPPDTGSRVAERQEEAHRLLDRADQLIDQAAEGLERAENKQAALARLELLLETAELTVNEVLAAEQEEALERAAEHEDAPTAAAIADILDDAEKAANAAAALANRIQRAGLARPLTARAKAAIGRIETLRETLAAV
jgi:hypothetical protein